MKQAKRIMAKTMASFIACTLLFMVFPIGAFANTLEGNTKNGEPIVEYRCLSDIEAGNRLAKQMWEDATSDGTSNLDIDDYDKKLLEAKGTTNYYNKVTSKTQSFLMPNGSYAQITFTATIDYSQNSSGSTFIFNVRNYTAFGANSNTDVSVLSKSYSLIDSGRTMAAYFSLKVGVKTLVGNTWNYYNKSYYVEYHPNNQITIYG